MKVIIDRFEENFAVCEKESGEMINIEVAKLPMNIKEGDILIVDGNTISIDEKCTKARKEKINKLAEDLWE